MSQAKAPPALNTSALTDPGRRRTANQDWWGQVVPSDRRILAQKGALFVVADGMGGRVGGEVASRLAVQYLLQAYYRDPSRQLEQSLARALQVANRQVYSYGYHYPAYRGMATTLVAAVVRGQELVVAHVGDSRAYLARAGRTWPLTSDHSWVAEMVARGALSPADAARHPYRHVITRSIGARPDVQVDVRRLRVSPGDTLVLCTDGLSDLVTPAEIGWVAATSAPQHATRRLVELANQRGGGDNVSALVVRLEQPARQAARPGSVAAWPPASVSASGARCPALAYGGDIARFALATGLAAAGVTAALVALASL
jgi:serine/threonine protein phosphatase PrpC